MLGYLHHILVECRNCSLNTKYYNTLLLPCRVFSHGMGQPEIILSKTGASRALWIPLNIFIQYLPTKIPTKTDKNSKTPTKKSRLNFEYRQAPSPLPVLFEGCLLATVPRL